MRVHAVINNPKQGNVTVTLTVDETDQPLRIYHVDQLRQWLLAVRGQMHDVIVRAGEPALEIPSFDSSTL